MAEGWWGGQGSGSWKTSDGAQATRWCDRVFCPWCHLQAEHGSHSSLQERYDIIKEKMVSMNKEVEKDLPWLNATIEHAEAELAAAGTTFSKISLTAPINIWKKRDTHQLAHFPAPYRAPGQPRQYGVWGEPGTADVQPPESSSTAEPTTKGGAESKKKKTDCREEVEWMARASDEDFAAYLTE